MDNWAKKSRLVPALVGLKQPSDLIVACIERLSDTPASEDLRNVPPTNETVATLRCALTGDQVASVRAAALESIWLARSKYPNVLTSVRSVAKHDPSEDVRKAATRLLERAISLRHEVP